jgi:CRP/FNR family transcriptional regulator, cyclic AMP receptor protein
MLISWAGATRHAQSRALLIALGIFINFRAMLDINTLICWGGVQRKMQKGEILFREGDSARFYYQVVSGKVKMMNCTESGKEFIQGMFGEGESFGEPPLFDGQPYPACAVAEEESVVIRLCRESFFNLLKEDFELHLRFTQMLAARLRYKSMMARELACHEPEHRVVTLLHYYKKSESSDTAIPYRVKLTRQQIADMTGLRVETVIRTIRNLNRDGKLVINRGKVYC